MFPKNIQIPAKHMLATINNLTFPVIAVLIRVIASEAKQSLTTGLLRHFVPRNDTLKIESRNSVSVRDNVIIWTCLSLNINKLWRFSSEEGFDFHQGFKPAGDRGNILPGQRPEEEQGKIRPKIKRQNPGLDFSEAL